MVRLVTYSSDAYAKRCGERSSENCLVSDWRPSKLILVPSADSNLLVKSDNSEIGRDTGLLGPNRYKNIESSASENSCKSAHRTISEYWRDVLRYHWPIAIQSLFLVVVIITLGPWIGFACNEDVSSMEEDHSALWRFPFIPELKTSLDFNPTAIARHGEHRNKFDSSILGNVKVYISKQQSNPDPDATIGNSTGIFDPINNRAQHRDAEMFRSHAARNDTCCPEYEIEATTKAGPNYRNDRPNYAREGTRRNENSYLIPAEDDEYCSCDFSDFEEPPPKPIKHRRSSRAEPSKLATRDRLREKHAREDGSILRTAKNSSSRRNHDRSSKYAPKANRKSEKTSRFGERTQVRSPHQARNHPVRVRTKEADGGSKYRSKSLGAKVDRSAPAEIKETCRRRSKVEKSLRLEDKSGKIERRYSRRDVKKADGVTEVTSLEIVRNCSRRGSSPTTAGRVVEKTVGNTRWPSRKSTKVIFARYSQDSVDDNVSEISESIAVRDSSEGETCTCYARPTEAFDADCDIEGSSSECLDFLDGSTVKAGMPFVDERQKADSCICHDCPMRGRRVEDKGVPRRKRGFEAYGGRRSSSLDRDARKGRRLSAIEKLIPDVVGLNNEYSSQRAKVTERKASLGRVCVTRNPDVQDQSSGHRENFSRREVREERSSPPTKRPSKVVTRRNPERHSVETAKKHEKFCKMFNTPETRNMMGCCCAASQLDDDHGCSVDCRCPESFLAKRTENPETLASCCPEGHREATGSALKNRRKTLGRARYRCTVTETSGTSNSGRENMDHGTRLSRIGYVEERDEECESDVMLTERHLRGSDERQPCGSSCCPSLEDGSTICCCPEEESEVGVRGKFGAEDTSGRDECLEIADLCPEVPPPDHWRKCGDRLKRVTEEYRTLSSRLRDMQREAETPETSGRMRKRISRKYPSGKEFSFEVKTIADDRGKTQDGSRDDDFCPCEEPVEDPEMTRREVVHPPGRGGSPDRYRRSDKTRDRSTRAMSEDDFVPCDCSPLERKKKRWKPASEDTDLVKILEAFCAKAKALDRELESTCDDKKMAEKIEEDDCECDESEDVEESEFSCGKYCDACVGTDSTGRIKRVRSEEITMAPRIAKSCGAHGKTNLKKIFIYPPDGEDGPPLTLLKKSSDIDCTIVSDANNRFRYKVTYKQNFWSPAWCPVDECCGGAHSDEYRSTDDYG